MSVQLYLAPASGGKTTAALELARATAAGLNAEVRVCVPTGLQARAWRRRLARAGGAMGVHVLTFDRMVAAILNEAGEAYTELSEPVGYRLLRQIIDRLPLPHYEPLKAKPGFIQVVQGVIIELKTARIDPLDFATAVAGLGGEPRLRELAAIYTAYQAQLQAQAWADRVGLHWLAEEALAKPDCDACRDWPLLIVNGFDDFTPSQLALWQRLAVRVGQMLITLPQAEKVTFQRYENTRREVEAALGIEGQPLANPTPDQPVLDYLARHLFTRSREEPVPNDGALTLREAPNRAAEVRTALRWLKQRIVWQGVSPDNVALLARDITPYRPFIGQIAAEFGLPVRLVEGQPLEGSPIIAALLDLLRLHLPAGDSGGASLPRRQVVAAWRSPYFDWDQGDVAITPADADALDALARQGRVIRGREQWTAAFTAGGAAREDPRPEDEEGGPALAGTAVQGLARKFDHFLALITPPAAGSMRAFVRWLEDLIGPDPQAPGRPAEPESSLQLVAQARANPGTVVADVAALRTLKEILRGLVWAEEALGERQVDYPYFVNELSGAVAAARYSLPARADQPEILVADALQARGLSFEAVVVLGLSEGSFPATISEDPFLRDTDRQALRERGFPLEPSTLSAEREFFYDTVSRARRKLLLTRPVLADNGAEWVASPFWEAVLRWVDIEPEIIPSEMVVPLAETASWTEWWETAAANGSAVGVQQPGIWEQIQAASQLWQARQTQEKAAWDGDLSHLAPELAWRYGPGYTWSASSLETYQTCGFFFFLSRTLGLQPRPDPIEGLDATQSGTLYHNIFEKVTRDGLPDPLEEAALRRRVVAVAGPILDAAPEDQGFQETPWWGQTRQEIVDNVVASLLLLADGDYHFYQAEAAFGFKGQTPLTIRDGDDVLKLCGYIDRIDRNKDDQLRIIDYKSGSKAYFNNKAFEEGKKLQLPLYALAAQDALGLGPVAEGFYWHFHAAEPSHFQLSKVENAIDTAVAYAWQAVLQIRQGEFTPKPPQGGCPSYCPAAGFCWHYTPSGW